MEVKTAVTQTILAVCNGRSGHGWRCVLTKSWDGCWVAVDVEGFTYTSRVICPWRSGLC